MIYFRNRRCIPRTGTVLFSEKLGRAVATYGFLERVLGRAVFALTATTIVPSDKIEDAMEAWSKTLEGSLKDALGRLISRFEQALRGHGQPETEDERSLLDLLKAAKPIRDVLCHAFWQPPDEGGRSLPWFVNNSLEACETPIDVQFLVTTQLHVAELACAVISSVTSRGLQFPGSNGPGRPIA